MLPEADLPRDICGLCLTDQDISPHLACLSGAEQGRFQRIRHPRAKRHFVLGRSALRTLLGEQLNMEPQAVPLWTDEVGAVRCEVPGWRCSIAHSEQRVIAVAARRRIGVDVERIQPRDSGIADNMVRCDEQAMFDALPVDRVRAVILCWTLKEAALKAVRIGLRKSAKACRLDIDYAASTASALIVESAATLHAAFAEQEGYFVSVAWGRALS
ncbi:MAG: 4'-phosphopantetheinyl transferase superfamily protein [Bacteroidota bacterium]|nr:4'-phosphopantetheinyl transferase superfamily protein [Bacteroidota bacterium]MDE2957432.1 4'-phosphopantetheinyl transferase superfamily protein [Bacteroidota bacterium]